MIHTEEDKRKKWNAKFQGYLIVATSEIRRDTEIFIDYNLKYN